MNLATLIDDEKYFIAPISQTMSNRENTVDKRATYNKQSKYINGKFCSQSSHHRVIKQCEQAIPSKISFY
jgi:hypothetical protein